MRFPARNSSDFTIEDESGPLAISDLKNDIVSSREDQDIKAVISWKSNRSSIAEIDYSKNGEGTSETVAEEGNYGSLHSIVISALASDAVYNYTIKSWDKNGDEAVSDKFAFYTGAANASILDVLGGAVRKLFGWAMKE